MAEITIGDVLQWQRTLSFRPAIGEREEVGLERPISWAVTVRTTQPILPALRGGEIVVVPPGRLQRLRESDIGGPVDLVRILADQPIAALMVDPEFAEHQLPGVRLLVTSGTFPHDAEANLNRLLTERRAELYRLGSELSRALSAASIAGAGLDALLDSAAAVANRELVLQDADGTVLASSRGARDGGALSAGTVQRLLRGVDGEAARVTTTRGVAWLSQPLGLGSGRPGRRGSVLSIQVQPTASREAERLVVTQTAAALELMLGHGGATTLAASERANREALVADLLLGRLVSRDAADARARLLGIDPTRPARVALMTSTTPGFPAKVRAILPQERKPAGAALGECEYSLILAEPARFAQERRDLAALARTLHAADPTTLLVFSEEVRGAATVAQALAQARALARLARAGAIGGAVIDAADVGTTGLYGLLYPLYAGHDLDRPSGHDRLRAYAAALLGPLETHDRKRRSNLVATLDAWLRHGGALAEAADQLAVHRNTLAYRLGRIEELTGLNLGDTQTRFLLQIALAVRLLERALDE